MGYRNIFSLKIPLKKIDEIYVPHSLFIGKKLLIKKHINFINFIGGSLKEKCLNTAKLSTTDAHLIHFYKLVPTSANFANSLLPPTNLH